MYFLFQALVAGAIVLMLTGLWMAIRLRRIASGGTIGKVVNTLLVLILMFTAGYFAAPFMPYLPPEAGLILTAVVFFFGAAYVIIVLWLITRLVRQVEEALGLE